VSSLAGGVFTLLAGRELRYLAAVAGAAVVVLTALVTTDATLKETPWARRLTVITAAIGAGAVVSVGTIAGVGSPLVGAIVVVVILGGYRILHCIEQRHRK